MFRKLTLMIIAFTAAVAFANPAMAMSMAAEMPGVEDQTTEQTQSDADEEPVVCAEIVIGRDRIPNYCNGGRNEDEEIVCRNVPVTGSRIAERVCITKAEHERQNELDQEFIARNSQNLNPYR